MSGGEGASAFLNVAHEQEKKKKEWVSLTAAIFQVPSFVVAEVGKIDAQFLISGEIEVLRIGIACRITGDFVLHIDCLYALIKVHTLAKEYYCYLYR